MKNFFFCVIMLSALTSCTFDHAPEPVPFVPPVNDTDEISYSKDIVPILETYCYGINGQACHVTVSNQGANGDFTTYAGLKEKVDNGSIEARVIDPNGGMPPSYSNSLTELADSDLFKFETWVNEGAKNN